MKSVVVAVFLTMPGLVLACSSAAFAEVPFHAFATTDTRAFNACLYAAWVEDYCRNIAFWSSSRSFGESFLACVYANKGGKFALVGRIWYNTEEYCKIRTHDR
jgi:hypothetical protein